jgi:hypothetical protein
MFMLLNACGTVTPSAISPDTGTAVAHTQTAVMWTPTVTATPDPDEKRIVEWLNGKLNERNPLERTIDAQYHVLDVSFPLGPSSNPIFRVDMRCECPLNQQCCIPERMFVVLMGAMSGEKDNIYNQVPGSVLEIHLFCYNRQTPIGTMVASWKNTKRYLDGQITGDQLGWQVFKTNIP